MHGYLDIDELSQLAIEIWGDYRSLGEQLAWTLHDLELRPYDRGELLTRLRTIADTQAEIEREKAKKPPNGGGQK